MTLVRIGKIGGRPFSSRENANDFITKYGVRGYVVEELSFGFTVEVEEGSFHQIDARRIDGTANEFDHTNFYRPKDSLKPGNDSHLFAPIDRILEVCLANEHKLDSNTFSWIQQLKIEHENNNTLQFKSSFINRLNSAYSRAK